MSQVILSPAACVPRLPKGFMLAAAFAVALGSVCAALDLQSDDQSQCKVFAIGKSRLGGCDYLG
jgi:hypothetical protein